MIANTWLTVIRGVERDAFEDFSDTAQEAGTDAQTRFPASLVEVSRSISDPASGTPRVVRSTIARPLMPVDVTEDDRLRDERTGRVYAVTAVTQPTAIGFTPGPRLDLTLIN